MAQTQTLREQIQIRLYKGEKYEFYILKDGDWKKVETKTTGNMSTNEQNTITYTYEKLTSLGEGEKYQFKIVAIRGKREVEKTTDSEIKNVEIAIKKALVFTPLLRALINCFISASSLVLTK